MLALAGVFVAEIVLTLTDFVVEIAVRRSLGDVYAGERVANTTSIVVEIVRELPHRVGFQVLPRRWVIERFFAWINRNRRLAKDVERTIASAEAFLYAAAAILLLRRLARS